jgi:superfamily II DNA/RNA helicase
MGFYPLDQQQHQQQAPTDAELVVGTPMRVAEAWGTALVERTRNLQWLVLDEADTLLMPVRAASHFHTFIRKNLERLHAYLSLTPFLFLPLSLYLYLPSVSYPKAEPLRHKG